jgi:hypothetical protein
MDAVEPTQTAKEMLEYEGYEDVLIFSGYSYDAALLGVTACNRAVYDYDRMVEWLAKHERISHEEAAEWIDYNTVTAAGPNGPLILHRLRIERTETPCNTSTPAP